MDRKPKMRKASFDRRGQTRWLYVCRRNLKLIVCRGKSQRDGAVKVTVCQLICIVIWSRVLQINIAIRQCSRFEENKRSHAF